MFNESTIPRHHLQAETVAGNEAPSHPAVGAAIERADTMLGAAEEDGSHKPTYQDIVERHPEWPALDLHVRYSSHSTLRDFRGVDEHLANPATRPHIYLYECLKVATRFTQAWQELSDNPPQDIEAYIDQRYYRGKHREVQVRGLAGSGIAVGSIDLQASRPEEVVLADRIDKLYNPVGPAKDFEDKLSKLIENARQSATLQRKREGIMAKHLEPEIGRLLQDRPDLAMQTDLSIYLTLGSFHTMFFHDLRQTGFTISRSFSQIPYLFGYNSQLEREFMMNPARPNSEALRELAAKRFIEDRIAFKINIAFTPADTNAANIYCRALASQFSTDEIRELFDEQQDRSYGGLERRINLKGLGKIPKTDAELQNAANDLLKGA